MAGASFDCDSDINITWKSIGAAYYDCPEVDIRLYKDWNSYEASIELNYPNSELVQYLWSSGTAYCGNNWFIRISCSTTLTYLGFSGSFTLESEERRLSEDHRAGGRKLLTNDAGFADSFNSYDSSVWYEQCPGCYYSSGSLYIGGDGESMRSKHAYSLSGRTISGTLVKRTDCDDHHVVISSSSDFSWSWSSESGSVKFVWNCDSKYIYGQSSSTYTSCSAYTTYNIEIRISASTVDFVDDICGTLSISDSLAGSYSSLYVYIGADADDTSGTDGAKWDCTWGWAWVE